MSSRPPPSQQAIIGFLNAAFDGDLQFLKMSAKYHLRGQGLAEVYMRIRDNFGRTCLHLAARGGRTKVCKYLIHKLKLDVNLKDNDGITPLLEATMVGELNTVVFLINNGANISATNDKGLTALHFAAQAGCKDFLEVLISKGAEIDAQSESGTPLQCAAGRAHTEAVKFLLEKKANPNAVSHNLFTPLIASILASSFECLTLLLKAGADPNLSSCMLQPLETACTEGEIDMMKALLEAGANPNAVDDEGMTPLERAALQVNNDAMQILFPVTSHISTIPEWSCRSIIEHVHSEESKKKREAKEKEVFLYAKSQGEASFKSREYLNALFWYTRANNYDPSNARVLANRSLCWVKLNEGESALADAEAAIKLDPTWAKAYYRTIQWLSNVFLML